MVSATVFDLATCEASSSSSGSSKCKKKKKKKGRRKEQYNKDTRVKDPKVSTKT